jgi:hypothetical protein
MGDEKSKIVKKLRATIKELSADDFDDFETEMPALVRKANRLVQKLAAA